jgi:hypothetical protein
MFHLRADWESVYLDLGTIMHGWDEMEKDGICDFMILIILYYINKTQVSVSGKLTIIYPPAQMSLGIFTEKASIVFDFSSINTFLPTSTYTLFIGL